MKKALLFLATVFLTALSWGQILLESTMAGDLPKLIPPSPEVASLAKVGQVGTSLHTGSAEASLSFHTIMVGSISVPVGLRYFTNGLRVYDIPSRVGLGWNFAGGGSISRVIHDEADDETDFLTPPAEFQTINQALINYLDSANNDNNDNEHDEYSISAPGISGRFFFDIDSIPRFVFHSNLKIERQSNGSGGYIFIITRPDGVKYYFGEAGIVEKTRDVQANTLEEKHIIQTTAWFLTRIVSPEGHWVRFIYDDIYIRTKQGPFQTVTLQLQSANSTACNICEGRLPSVAINNIDYDTYFLDSITTSFGHTLEFDYEARPDASFDNRLVEVEVSANDGTGTYNLVKKFTLEYEDLDSTGTNNKFYLTKLNNISCSGSADTLTHLFEYNSGQLPSTESLAQDYFGYYNGLNNSNLFPRPSNYSDYAHGSEGGNRTPDFDYAQRGALKRITYPQGGFEEFIYEPNDILQSQTNTVYDTASVSGSGFNYDDPQILTDNFSPDATQVAHILINTYMNPGAPSPGHPNYNPPDNIWRITKVEVIRTSGTPQTVFSATIRNYIQESYTLSLVGGLNYQLKVTVYGSTNAASVYLSYDPNDITIPTNVEGCGIRVQKIRAYDHITDKYNTRFFKYSSLAELSKSSGVGTLTGSNFAPAYQGGWCQTGSLTTLIECNEYPMQISSSSLTGIYTFSGSPIAYTHVIESNDSTFSNGGIEHEYYTYYVGGGGATVLNHPIFNVPTAIQPDFNGIEKRTTYFKKLDTLFVPIKETVNEFSFDSTFSYYQVNTMVRKRWDSGPASTLLEKTKGFDVTQYLLMSGWIKLDKTTVSEYDQSGSNPLTFVTTYEYDNVDHLLPTVARTVDSKGDSLKTVSKYPADFVSTPYNDMVDKHIINPIVERTVYLNNNLLATKTSNYDTWHNGRVLSPELVTSRKSTGPINNRMYVHKYDTLGNQIEISEGNDFKQVCLWDYFKSLPVAKIANADSANVAYTSFEADGKGTWVFSGSASSHSSAPTGLRGYSLSGGDITRSIDNTITYTITYWKRDSSSTVTLNSNLGTALATRNGWILYQHSISGTSSITISGSAFIDELRLHPSNALMSTTTFNPLVGVTSECDANNKITYYEYDGFGRLKRVKDQDKNIIKIMDHKYQQTQIQ